MPQASSAAAVLLGPDEPARDRSGPRMRLGPVEEAGHVVRRGPGVGVQRQDAGRPGPGEGRVHPAREAQVLAERDRLERDVRRSVRPRRLQAAVPAGAVHHHDLQRPVIEGRDRLQAARQVGRGVVGDDADGDRQSLAHGTILLKPETVPASTARIPENASRREAARRGRRKRQEQSRRSIPSTSATRAASAQTRPWCLAR